jgi:flagellar protein FlgJ
MLTTDTPSVYTDFNSLSKLKLEAHNQSADAIEKVAKQFESVFINMMLKSMRQANLSEGLLDSQQSEYYRDMYDQQIAMELSSMPGKPGKSGIGIAEFIVRQLTPKQQQDDTEDAETAFELHHPEEFVGGSLPKRHNYNARSAYGKPMDASGLSNLEKTLSGLASRQQKFNEQWQSLDDEWDSQKLVQGQQSSSKMDFITQLLPHAKSAARELGVDVNLLLSQAALETGWGQAVIKNNKGESSFNLFNIKADRSWAGKQTKALTLEFVDGVAKKEIAGFRSYHSYKESFDDYVNLLKSNPRYSEVLKKAANPAKYMHELQQAGYATDPRYAEKVMNIYSNQTAINVRPINDAG